MNQEDYNVAYAIGFDHAREVLGRLDAHHPDRDDAQGFDDRAFPDAFSEALSILENEDAPDVSEAVHEGIVNYWRTTRYDTRYNSH